MYKTILPFEDFMYILQLEEYDTVRYIKWLKRFFFRRHIQQRDLLKWSVRAKVIFIASVILYVSSLLLLIDMVRPDTLWITLLILICTIFIPLYVCIANLMTGWYFDLLKRSIRIKAQGKVQSLPHLKVIMIAGSYGKTTVKNYIFQLIKYAYPTQMIPGNINTSAGIARWILDTLKPSTEILIVEADTYGTGQLAEIMRITPPVIAVLTNIGDQHLERFKDEIEHRNSLLEIIYGAKDSTEIVITTDIQRFIDRKDMHIIDSQDKSSDAINKDFAIAVAQLLSIPALHIHDEVSKLVQPDRRQKKATLYGYDAIDDSYNISYTTAMSSIKVALDEAHSQHKKLLVVTAGIPELSQAMKHKNTELGNVLRQHADYIVILGSMFAHEIASGIHDPSLYTQVPDLQSFMNIKSQWETDRWFLLLLPELTDLYY